MDTASREASVRLAVRIASQKKVFLKVGSVKFRDVTQIERHKHSGVRDSFTANNKNEGAASFEHDHDHICTSTSSMSDIEGNFASSMAIRPVPRVVLV